MTQFIRLVFSVSFVIGCLIVTTTVGFQCSKAGVACDPCNIVLCPAPERTPILISNCSLSEQKCEMKGTSAQCVPGRCSDPAAPHPFLCTEPGFFPSAYKCNVTYFCRAPLSAPAYECTCDEGKVYDFTTGSCITGECTPATCTSPFEDKKLNDKFCYVCDSNLDAMLYRCGGSDAPAPAPVLRSLKHCGPYTGPPPSGAQNSLPTTEPPTSPTTSPTTELPSSVVPPPTLATTSPTTKPSPTVTPPTLPAPPPTAEEPPTLPTPPPTTEPSPTTQTPLAFTCARNGQREADPTNCKNYYQCNATLVPIRFTCSGRYDPVRLGCVSGTCSQ